MLEELANWKEGRLMQQFNTDTKEASGQSFLAWLVWSWIIFLTTLGLSFLICKTRIKIALLGEQAFGAVAEVLLGTPPLHVSVSEFDSSFLLCAPWKMVGDDSNTWCLSLPCGRPRLSSKLLISSWPAPTVVGIWEVKLMDGRSFSVSIS